MAEYQDPVLRNAGARTGTAELDQGLRSYMLKVYNYMSLGIAFTALITLFMAANPGLMMAVATGPMMWVLFIGILGLGFMAPRIIFSGNRVMAQASFWVYAALWGVLISPMVAFYLSVDPTLIFRAFLITSVTFASMSLLGYTTKRDLSPFATFFFMAAIGLLIAIVVNVIFFQSTLMSLVTSGLVVLLFAGMTAWETQTIKELYYEGDTAVMAESKSIFGAFMLYGSFVTLFIHILNILGIMRE